MASKKLDQLCRSILPANFRQVSDQGSQIQHFLQENLPENIRPCVTLLTVSSAEIVISANSAMVANYLRLHSLEIKQQFAESLNLQQTIKFITVPDSLLKVESRYQPVKPDPVSAEAIASISKNAEWVEDENLKQALLSLAASLKEPR